MANARIHNIIVIYSPNINIRLSREPVTSPTIRHPVAPRLTAKTRNPVAGRISELNYDSVRTNDNARCYRRV